MTQANRPQFADGEPVPSTVDATTAEADRGVDQVTGAKGAEPAEPVPTLTALAPNNGVAAGGTVVTATGDNLGGSTAVTVGGVAATAVQVLSETQIRFTTGAHAAGAGLAVVVANPAGPSVGGPTFAYT